MEQIKKIENDRPTKKRASVGQRSFKPEDSVLGQKTSSRINRQKRDRDHRRTRVIRSEDIVEPLRNISNFTARDAILEHSPPPADSQESDFVPPTPYDNKLKDPDYVIKDVADEKDENPWARTPLVPKKERMSFAEYSKVNTYY